MLMPLKALSSTVFVDAFISYSNTNAQHAELNALEDNFALAKHVSCLHHLSKYVPATFPRPQTHCHSSPVHQTPFDFFSCHCHLPPISSDSLLTCNNTFPSRPSHLTLPAHPLTCFHSPLSTLQYITCICSPLTPFQIILCCLVVSCHCRQASPPN